MVATAIGNTNTIGGIGTLPGTYPGNSWGNNWGNYPSNFRDYNSVISLRNSVNARINTGVSNGSLTTAEANMLRADFNRINAQLDRRNLRGNLNFNPVVRRLVALDQRVTQMINDSRFAGYGNWWY
jgi:hypothetical protein